jgi:Zn-dependent protease
VFLSLVAILIGAGVYLWSQRGPIDDPSAPPSTVIRVGIFVFVAVGWIISLCVHEFMHAVVAWKGGDRTVEARGYLTLDPRRYMNRQLSIVLPIIIVLLGGIGLPGGAVMVDRRLIPSRRTRSLVAAAGPCTNAAFAVLCAAPLELHWIGGGHRLFASAIALLALLEVAVTVLNSLPIPGLDGFGILSPYLPDETVRSLVPMSPYVFLGLIFVLFWSTAANKAFYNFCFRVMADLGVNRDYAVAGQLFFTFWRHL